MKLLNIHKSDITAETFGFGTLNVLKLGERGRGRYAAFLPFQCEIDEDASDYAVALSRSGRNKIVRRPDAPKGFIVRVNTHYAYTRNSVGDVRVLHGSADVVAKGYGAFGDAGALGGWHDVVFAVTTFPTVLYVTPSGGRSKVSPYWLVFLSPDQCSRVSEDEKDVFLEACPFGDILSTVEQRVKAAGLVYISDHCVGKASSFTYDTFSMKGFEWYITLRKAGWVECSLHGETCRPEEYCEHVKMVLSVLYPQRQPGVVVAAEKDMRQQLSCIKGLLEQFGLFRQEYEPLPLRRVEVSEVDGCRVFKITHENGRTVSISVSC